MGVKKALKRAVVEETVCPEFIALMEELKRQLVLYDEDYVHVVLGTMFANRLNSIPTWLYLAGQPSGGKTAMLSPLAAHPSAKMVSRWTEQTLISGHGKQGGKTDSSLLPELDGRVLVIKDLTSALAMNRQTAQSILGELRDAFDGSYAKGFGVKDAGQPSVVKEYKSKFGLIAGVTHSIDKCHSVVGELGERFLLYRLPDMPRELSKKANRRVAGRYEEKEKNLALEEKVCALLDRDWPELADGHCLPRLMEWQIDELDQAAYVGALLRAQVPRERNSKEKIDGPSPEAPMRIMQQLCNLAVGMSWAKGLSVVDKEDLRRAKKVALHGCTRRRKDLIEYLLDVYMKDWVSGREEEAGYRTLEEMNQEWDLCGQTHGRIMLEDLVALGLAEVRFYVNSKSKAGMKWRITTDKEIKETLDVLRMEKLLGPDY